MYWRSWFFKLCLGIFFLILCLKYTSYSYSRTMRTTQNHSIQFKKNFLFCIILTAPKHLKSGRALTVLNIWAHKCSNYAFITVIPSKRSIKIRSIGEPLNLYQPEDLVEENYSKLTDKVYSAFRDIYRDHKNYDWYLKCDDDTFVHMDHFIEFFSSRDPKFPTTYGYDVKRDIEKGYPAGGSGYVMSNKAFLTLGEKLTSNVKFCPNYGVEDMNVGECFRKLHIYPSPTVDHLGRDRFNNWDIKQHYLGPMAFAYKNLNFHTPRIGADCCSDSFISFHYMQPDQQMRLHTVIQRLKRLLYPREPTFTEIAEDYLRLETYEIMIGSRVTNDTHE